VSGLTLSNAPMGRDRQVGGIRKWWHSRLGAPLLLEIVIVVTLLLIYKAARLLAEGDHEIAVQHALQVIDIERALGVFNEENAQRLVIKSTAAIKFLNVYYLWAHFSVTIAMLVWLYVLARLVIGSAFLNAVLCARRATAGPSVATVDDPPDRL